MLAFCHSPRRPRRRRRRPDRGRPRSDDLDADRFAITFFVLKRFAFGPIQKTIDERRERIRRPSRRPTSARDEARDLLEEHRQLIGQARGRGRGDPHGGPQGRGRAARAREGGDRGRPRAPARGDEAPDRGRDEALARPDPRRGRRPHARGERAGDGQDPRRRGSAPADRRGDRRARLLRAGEGEETSAWPSRTHVRRALFEAAREAGGLDERRGRARGARRRDREMPELRAFLANPQVDPAGKATVLEQLIAGAGRARAELRPARRREGPRRRARRDQRRARRARRPRAEAARPSS